MIAEVLSDIENNLAEPFRACSRRSSAARRIRYNQGKTITSFLADSVRAEILTFARQKDILPDGIVGVSRAVQGICVRALAMSGDMLFRFFERFEQLV